ncbi:MAG: alpha-mannosidase [Bacteroidaceae bacterium]|nr:alpha-mannosidase [Bacteroidaceae bacterium]
MMRSEWCHYIKKMNAREGAGRWARRLLLCLSCGLAMQAGAQENYFVDGFHGGVYGHYPLAWYTDFIVDQLEANPQWRISLELEPETWDSVRCRTPQAYERFGRVVGGSQVEVVNPTYAQPYLYNISGESIVRQFQAGIRKWHEHFPGLRFLTYSSEEPCFTSCLPMILKQLGIRQLSLKCPDTCWGGYMAPMGGQFISLTGPDGTALPCVPRYDQEALQDSSVWQTTAWQNSAEYLQACTEAGIRQPVGMCLQDAGWKGGPWLKGEAAKRSEYTLWRDYFANHLKDNVPTVRQFSQEDVRPALMWGTQILQRIAQAVRKAEEHLIQTEKLCAMAAMAGHPVRDDRMDEAWRTLMLSQHHDSWIVPYNRLKGRRTWAQTIIGEWIPSSLHISDSLRSEAVRSMDLGNGQREGALVRIFNTTGTAREEWVVVRRPQGDSVRLWVRVPAFGYATYDLRGMKATEPSTESPKEVAADEVAMENDRLRLVIDLRQGGTLKSLCLKDKEGEVEFVRRDANYRLGELRGYFGERGSFCSSTEERATARWIAQDDARQTLAVQGRIAGVDFEKIITLKGKGPEAPKPGSASEAQGPTHIIEDGGLIDVRLRIDWRENLHIGEPTRKGWPMRRRGYYDTRYMLGLLLPTRMREPQLYKDAPFDVCHSQQRETFFNRWDSIRHNVLLHWLDITDGKGKYGLTLLSDHTTSYSMGDDFPLSLTLQYSGPGLWDRDYPLHGPTEIHYALYPHRETWELADVQGVAQAWQEPLIVAPCERGPIEEKCFVDLKDSGYRLSAAWAQGGKLGLRLYNASGDSTKRRITLGFDAKRISEVNLLDEPLRDISVHEEKGQRSFDTTIPRHGIATLLFQGNRHSITQ